MTPLSELRFLYSSMYKLNEQNKKYKFLIDRLYNLYEIGCEGKVDVTQTLAFIQAKRLIEGLKNENLD